MQAILSIILSVYVLIGSIGTPLSMHTCYALDKTEYGFDLSDSCCGEDGTPKETKITSSECCDFFSTYLQVDYETYSNLSFFSFVAPVAAVQEFNFEYSEHLGAALIQNIDGRSPPLKSGRSLLTFIQTFII